MSSDPFDALGDPDRLAALRRTALLDTPAEAAFDRLTGLASRLLHAPVALVSLADADRVFFKSCLGLPEPWSARRESPFSHAFCQHVVATSQPLLVEDAREHPKLHASLAVLDLGVVAYAGIPLATSGGQVLGSFCVIDHRPRRWTDDEVATLRDLAASVMTEIELRTDAVLHRETEARLRDSESRYRQLVESASDIIYRTDARGCFTYANPVATRILGYVEEEILGTSYLELIREDFRDPTRDFYRRQVAERTPTTYYEFPTLSRDGHEVWIGQNVQLIFDGDAVVGMQAVARDITERREIDRMKDEFIAMVSHELRTPLASMRGSLGLVASGVAGTLEPQGKRLLEIALQNTERLGQLVNNILDVERLESGGMPVEPRETSAAGLMRAAADAMQRAAEQAGVALEVEPLDAPLRVDLDQIVQTITNLLANAVKFSPRGGTVRLVARRDGGEVRFCVLDQGPGIPPERREEVFQPFRQLDSSDTRRKGGTGLGLAICRSIVRQHGGRIWVEEAPGGGSALCFTLPLAGAEGGTPPDA